jgi:hypothetical protein
VIHPCRRCLAACTLADIVTYDVSSFLHITFTDALAGVGLAACSVVAALSLLLLLQQFECPCRDNTWQRFPVTRPARTVTYDVSSLLHATYRLPERAKQACL